MAAEYQESRERGLAANGLHDFATGAVHLENAYTLSEDLGIARLQLDTLQPLARSYWGVQRYGMSRRTLETAADIARDNKLDDEQAMVLSNMARLTTVQTLFEVPPCDQAEILEEHALPRYDYAAVGLAATEHYYYVYTNGAYGALTAALAGDRERYESFRDDVRGVALKKSPEPYDEQRTIFVSPKGVVVAGFAAVVSRIKHPSDRIADIATNLMI